MKFFLKLFFLLFLLSCSNNEDPQEQNDLDCSGDYSTAGILVDINEEIYNDDESVNKYSKYSWTSDGIDRILSGNGIPNHEVGTFPNAAIFSDNHLPPRMILRSSFQFSHHYFKPYLKEKKLTLIL